MADKSINSYIVGDVNYTEHMPPSEAKQNVNKYTGIHKTSTQFSRADGILPYMEEIFSSIGTILCNLPCFTQVIVKC